MERLYHGPKQATVSWMLVVAGSACMLTRRLKSLGAWMWIAMGIAGTGIGWDRLSAYYDSDPNFIAFKQGWKNRPDRRLAEEMEIMRTHLPYAIAGVVILNVDRMLNERRIRREQ